MLPATAPWTGYSSQKRRSRSIPPEAGTGAALDALDWRAQVALAEGLERTMDA